MLSDAVIRSTWAFFWCNTNEIKIHTENGFK